MSDDEYYEDGGGDEDDGEDGGEYAYSYADSDEEEGINGSGASNAQQSLLKQLDRALSDAVGDLMSEDGVQEAAVTVVGPSSGRLCVVVPRGRIDVSISLTDDGKSVKKVELTSACRDGLFGGVGGGGGTEGERVSGVLGVYVPVVMEAHDESEARVVMRERCVRMGARAGASAIGFDPDQHTRVLCNAVCSVTKRKNMAIRVVRCILWALFDSARDVCGVCGLPGGTRGPHIPCVSPDDVKQRLKDFLLSPAATNTEAVDQQAISRLPVMSDAQLLNIMEKLVPDVRKIRDRTGAVAAYTYVQSTYHQGLPNFRSQPALNQHTIGCLRYIFAKVSSISEGEAKTHMGRILDAFQACQAEQGRVIDAVYGSMSGRDKGFREQLLSLVDEQKQRVLDQVTVSERGGMVGANMGSHDIPHVQNGQRLAIGEKLGFSHMQMEAARSDQLARRLSAAEAQKLETEYRRAFSVDELVESFVGDVNQQDPEAQRVINRDSLCKWALAEGERSGGAWDPHCLYYDETKPPSAYKGALPPTMENRYQPFLSHDVALRVLLRAFGVVK